MTIPYFTRVPHDGWVSKLTTLLRLSPTEWVLVYRTPEWYDSRKVLTKESKGTVEISTGMKCRLQISSIYRTSFNESIIHRLDPKVSLERSKSWSPELPQRYVQKSKSSPGGRVLVYQNFFVKRSKL